MKNHHLNQLLQLGLASLFISTSGVLGRYINMPAPVTIWWRSALALLFLFIYSRYRKINLNLKSKKDIYSLVTSGLFLGGHWVTYFYSLKLSNVALALLSLYTFPVITALLEPLFVKVKFSYVHILLGVMVFLGLYILMPEFTIESSDTKGILLGLLSALLYSIRSLLLKQHVAHYDGTSLLLYQLIIISIVMLPVLYFMDTSGIETQYPYVLILALVTTAIGHSLFIHSLKYFSVSTASIISSLQPIYGITLAYLFLNEIPTSNTFYGGLLILGTVIIESIRTSKK